jgi:hypothetical protein
MTSSAGRTIGGGLDGDSEGDVVDAGDFDVDGEAGGVVGAAELTGGPVLAAADGAVDDRAADGDEAGGEVRLVVALALGENVGSSAADDDLWLERMT